MDIKGYENYTIDLDGNVWSKRKKRFICKSIKIGGYYYVVLNKNGKEKKFTVHRLMGLTYLPNIFNKPFIDHKNRNRKDNRLFNLKWATHEENNQNRGICSRNTSGYKNISFDKVNNSFKLLIKRNKKIIVKRYFSFNKWKIEQVVKIRDEYYKELDSTENLPFTNQTSTLNRRAS